MPEKISWRYVIGVTSGPTVSQTDVIEVDAYDKFAVTVDANASQKVQLFPAGGEVKLLVLSPGEPSDKLSYKVGNKTVLLDGPHVLIGAGAVSLLGSPAELTFTNSTEKAAAIQIIVGRDATP